MLPQFYSGDDDPASRRSRRIGYTGPHERCRPRAQVCPTHLARPRDCRRRRPVADRRFPAFSQGIVSPLDVALDVVVAVVLTLLVGWHIAFIPTFLIEALPF